VDDEDEDDAMNYFKRLAEEWLVPIKSDIIDSLKSGVNILFPAFFVWHYFFHIIYHNRNIRWFD
jgi:hypothetical protein